MSTAGDDSKNLRIAAIFIILVAGTLGVVLPALIRLVHAGDGKLPYRVRVILKLLSALGAGVVLSTAMLHTLPESKIKLTEGLELEDSHSNAAAGSGGHAHVVAYAAAHDHESHSESHSESHHDHHSSSHSSHDDHDHDHDHHGSSSHDSHSHSHDDHDHDHDHDHGSSSHDSHSHSHSHDDHDHDGHAGEGAAAASGHASHKHPYPWAELIAMGSLLAIYFVERELTTLLEERRDGERQTDASETETADSEESEEEAAARAAMKLHILEIAIAVHSIVIGFTVGALAEKDEVRTLLIALVVHQFCEGVAVGASIISSPMHRLHGAVLMAIFAVTAPLGVAIGIAVERAVGQDRGRASDIVQGVFGAIASGVLLYMALCDMFPHLGHTLAPDHESENCIQCAADTEEGGNEPAASFDSVKKPTEPAPPKRHPAWLRFLIVVAVIVGAASMAVLAKWA